MTGMTEQMKFSQISCTHAENENLTDQKKKKEWTKGERYCIYSIAVRQENTAKNNQVGQGNKTLVIDMRKRTRSTKGRHDRLKVNLFFHLLENIFCEE